MQAQEKGEKISYMLHLQCLASFIILLYAQNIRQSKMTKFPSMQLSTVPRRIKVIKEMFSFTETGLSQKRVSTILLQIIRVNNQNANAPSEISPTSETRANLAESVLTPSSLLKTKVFPLDDVQPKRRFSTSSIPRSNEASPQKSPE
jgi:hypothetical protein